MLWIASHQVFFFLPMHSTDMQSPFRDFVEMPKKVKRDVPLCDDRSPLSKCGLFCTTWP